MRELIYFRPVKGVSKLRFIIPEKLKIFKNPPTNSKPINETELKVIYKS